MFELIAGAKSHRVPNFWATNFPSQHFKVISGEVNSHQLTSELVVGWRRQTAGDSELLSFCSGSRQLSDGSSFFNRYSVLCLTSSLSTVIILHCASMSTNVAANFLGSISGCLFPSNPSTAVGAKNSGKVFEVLILCFSSFKWNYQQSLAMMRIRS